MPNFPFCFRSMNDGVAKICIFSDNTKLFPVILIRYVKHRRFSSVVLPYTTATVQVSLFPCPYLSQTILYNLYLYNVNIVGENEPTG